MQKVADDAAMEQSVSKELAASFLMALGYAASRKDLWSEQAERARRWEKKKKVEHGNTTFAKGPHHCAMRPKERAEIMSG
jgi:hypothetical protein